MKKKEIYAKYKKLTGKNALRNNKETKVFKKWFEEWKHTPKFHTITSHFGGTKGVSVEQKTATTTETATIIQGYSLQQIDTYFKRFIKGNPPKSVKERKFTKCISKYFGESKRRKILKVKTKSLTHLTKSKK